MTSYEIALMNHLHSFARNIKAFLPLFVNTGFLPGMAIPHWNPVLTQ